MRMSHLHCTSAKAWLKAGTCVVAEQSCQASKWVKGEEHVWENCLWVGDRYRASRARPLADLRPLMFTAHSSCSATEHARGFHNSSHHLPSGQLDRDGHAAAFRLLPTKGRTCKSSRYVSRAGSEERVREAAKLYTEGAVSVECS